MFECFHCLQRTVIWDNDYTYEDYGLEGEGLVHECHCETCGAFITYLIRLDEKENDEPVGLEGKYVH